MTLAEIADEFSPEEPSPSQDFSDEFGDGSGDGGDMPPAGGDDGGFDIPEPNPSPDLPSEQPPENPDLPPGTPGGPEGPPAPPDESQPPPEEPGGMPQPPTDSLPGMPPENPDLPPGTPGGPEGPPSPSGDGSGGGNHDLPGVQAILDWLQQRIQEIQNSIGEITNNITQGIAGLIESLVPPTIVALTGITSVVGDLVQGFLNQLAPTIEVGQMLQDSLTGGIPQAIQGFIDQTWSQRGDAIPALLDDIVNHPELPDNIKLIFTRIHEGTNPVEQMLGIFGLAGLMAAVGHTLLGPLLDKAGQGANVAFRPTLPDVGTLGDLLRRNQISDQDFNNVIVRLGYPDQWADILRDASFPNIPPDVIQTLRQRGLLDDDQYNAQWRTHGFSEAQAAAFDMVRWQVPSYTDLVHFMTRDAFWDSPGSPFGDIVHDFQLNFGEDQLPFDQFAKAGVPEEMARWAWRAHWEIPGRHDANEMFFRGALGDRSPGGEGEHVLERVYRARGIEPIFIQPLISTAFHPIGRIDIRRLIKSGAMDRDGAIEAYQQIGYNPSNANILADLAIQLSSQESESEREPFRAGLKQRIVSAFINGTLTADESSQALSDLHYHDDAIAQFISEAELERHAVLAGHIRSGVERLYTSAEWDADKSQAYLRDRGFSDDEIGRLFEWWIPIRELHDLKEEHKHHKEVTRSDVLTAYHDDTIDRDTAFVHLSDLGYTDNDAEMLLSHTDHQKAVADINSQIAAIHEAFTDRQIDSDSAIHELDAVGINGRRRDSLLRKWQLELERKKPELPLPMLEKLALAKLYTNDELTEELRQRHFSDSQIEKFTRLWGYEIEVVAKRVSTQSQREADAEKRRQEAEQRRKQAEARRLAAASAAEQRRHEAEQRRHEADERRAEADKRRAEREERTEHDRLARDARAGRLSIGRIRTGFTLGVLSESSSRSLMSAIGLRPEAVDIEMAILDAQLREKQPPASSTSGVGSTQQTTAEIAQ